MRILQELALEKRRWRTGHGLTRIAPDGIHNQNIQLCFPLACPLCHSFQAITHSCLRITRPSCGRQPVLHSSTQLCDTLFSLMTSDTSAKPESRISACHGIWNIIRYAAVVGTDLKLGRLAAFLEAKVGLGQPDDCLIQIHTVHIEAEHLMQVDRQASPAQPYHQNLALALPCHSLLRQSISCSTTCQIDLGYRSRTLQVGPL